MSEEDQEQEARIALLGYFGSLARNWATILLATAGVFLAVVQVRTDVGDWWFAFGLLTTFGGGAYAFIRMVTLGKYCELALDPEVRPRGQGIAVSQMLHGMLHDFRTNKKAKHGELLDKWGQFPGWLYGILGWGIGVFLALVDASICGLLPLPDLLSRLRFSPCSYAKVVIVGLIPITWFIIWLLFRRIDLEKYEKEREIPLNGFEGACTDP